MQSLCIFHIDFDTSELECCSHQMSPLSRTPKSREQKANTCSPRIESADGVGKVMRRETANVRRLTTVRSMWTVSGPACRIVLGRLDSTLMGQAIPKLTEILESPSNQPSKDLPHRNVETKSTVHVTGRTRLR